MRNPACILVSLLILALLPAAQSAIAQAPYMDPAKDPERFPPHLNPLTWTLEEKIVGFRNNSRLGYPTRTIEAGDQVLSLPSSPIDLSGVELSANGTTLTVDEYFERQNVAGLLVLKDGKNVYERYGLGNDENTPWLSFSVAKSVVAMLYGAALRDGYIERLDEAVTDYLPRLKGSSYDQSTLRDLLQMASGVAWNEDYADPESDVATASWSTLGLYEFLRDKPRAGEPGEVFNYNTAETNLAGTLLRSAIGNNLSEYLERKIWQPFGMEADAYWQLTETGGGEFGGCCISATLRDYGRLGLFALAEGKLSDGTPVLADGWMKESTTPSKGYAGYGYFWWLNDDTSYRAIGIFGQGICIHPEQNVVIALHSARIEASNSEDWSLQNALCRALADHLGATTL